MLVHSPLPWKVFHTPDKHLAVISTNGDYPVVVARHLWYADAALIVRAVNREPAFEALVKAGTALLPGNDDQTPATEKWDNLRKAVALAQEVK